MLTNGMIEFAFDSDDCDILTASNDTHIQYFGTLKNRIPTVSYLLRKVFKVCQGSISRLAEVFEIDISCEFSRNMILQRLNLDASSSYFIRHLSRLRFLLGTFWLENYWISYYDILSRN